MDDFIPVEVDGVFMISTIHGLTPIVIISNKDGKIMPMYVGMSEGISINSALNDEVTPRPMTHDLLVNLLNVMGIEVPKIEVSDIRNDTYY
ncbi:MAG: bifunctional nuclease family protein, partial [Nitrospirae bacterium]|nr:bifunctional nuclease family protein [Nitrospirota bacterium]